MKKPALVLLALPLACFGLLSGCSGSSVHLEEGDTVYTRLPYIDLSDVPEKLSFQVDVTGEISRIIIGSRIQVYSDQFEYKDGILTIDTSVLKDEDGDFLLSAGEHRIGIYADETVNVECLFLTKILYTVEDVLELNDYEEYPDAMAGSYMLGNDIDFSEVANFEPLGYSDSDDGTHYQDTFNGVFDGNGYTISGINTLWTSNPSSNKDIYEGNYTFSDISHRSGDSYGFFQEIGEAGIVRNLKFSDCSITARTIAGIVCGINSGIIENVIVDEDCSVMVSTHYYDESCNAAGIAGICGATGEVLDSVCFSTDISVLDTYTDYDDAYLDSDGVNYHVYYSGTKGLNDSNGTVSQGIYGGVGLTYGSCENSYSVASGALANFSQTHLESTKPSDGPDSGILVECGAYTLEGLKDASLYDNYDTSVWTIVDGVLPRLSASYPYIEY